MKPSGAGALLAQKTAREFQRLPDLHDDTAAASAAHQAGGLEGQSRVRDEGQHLRRAAKVSEILHDLMPGDKSRPGPLL